MALPLFPALFLRFAPVQYCLSFRVSIKWALVLDLPRHFSTQGRQSTCWPSSLPPAYWAQNSDLQELLAPLFSVSSLGCSCISFSEKKRWRRPLPKPPCLNRRLRGR